MESLKSASRSHTMEAASRFLKVGTNPSTGPIRYITTHEAGKRPRTTFQSDQDKEVACEREMYYQEKLAERDKRRRQMTSNPDYSMALDIKKCVLDVQKLCLEDLAVEENHIKDLARIPGATIIDLEKNHKEVERVITALRCRERETDSHSNDF